MAIIIEKYYDNVTIINLFREFFQCLIINIFPKNQLKENRTTYSFDNKANFFLNDVYRILEDKLILTGKLINVETVEKYAIIIT